MKAKKIKYHDESGKKRQAAKERYQDKKECIKQFKKENYVDNRISNITYQTRYQENPEMQLAYENPEKKRKYQKQGKRKIQNNK